MWILWIFLNFLIKIKNKKSGERVKSVHWIFDNSNLNLQLRHRSHLKMNLVGNVLTGCHFKSLLCETHRFWSLKVWPLSTCLRLFVNIWVPGPTPILWIRIFREATLYRSSLGTFPWPLTFEKHSPSARIHNQEVSSRWLKSAFS